MAIFNSYVSLPEGIQPLPPAIVNNCQPWWHVEQNRLSGRCDWPNVAGIGSTLCHYVEP